MASAGSLAGLPRAYALRRDRRVPGDPFMLGVASGDPWPDSVVLWTRLAPSPYEPDGGMP
ncbi:PhoD-like phosphatase N-terminal domain-containing protein, partial [Streptomyces syringium]